MYADVCKELCFLFAEYAYSILKTLVVALRLSTH